MATKSTTYFDPIGYKLYIGIESNQEILSEIKPAVMQLAEGFYPYAEAASKHYSPAAAMDFFDRVPLLFSEASAPSDFHTYWTDLESRFMACEYAAFSYIPQKLKIPRPHRKKLSIEMLPVCRQVNEYTLSDSIDGSLPFEIIEELVNCPSDDLRGIYVPRKNVFIANTLLLFYNRCELMKPQNDQKYLHRIMIQIPRYLADEFENGFNLQAQWTSIAEALCSRYEYATAAINMDTMSLTGFPGFSTGDMHIRSDHDNNDMRSLPGYAWGMCITRAHLEKLGGWERLQEYKDVLCSLKQLANGGAYLQLTSDINIVSKKENQRMYELMSSALRSGELWIDAIEIPSYRLYIPSGQLHQRSNFDYVMQITHSK